MKNILLSLLLLAPCFLFAQFGVKAGLNFANVTKASEINNSSETGYHLGLFLAGPVKTFMSSQTELLFSRQGYSYETNENTGKVNLDYLVLHQFLVLNFTKFVQLQVGGQTAFLLNAKVDSTQTSTGNSSVDDIISLMNRFDYGLSGGVEIHPIHLIVVGARVCYNFANLYKTPDPNDPTPPSFIPTIDLKNNLFQLYVGFKFGKEPDKNTTQPAPSK
jgi:hypothetical protein